MIEPNARIFVKKDPPTVQLYQQQSDLRHLVDYWINAIHQNKVSLIDFELAYNTTMYFLKNKENYDSWLRLSGSVVK